jgi:[CysO sulfur-carrier protein]-S-L-cysteine hydrolase
MAVAIRLRREHLDSMIAHALEDAPIECCGLLAQKDGEVVSVHRAKNVEASPYRFSVNPLETRRLSDAMDEAGSELAGFYHSHTGSDPIPSPTDVRMMGPLFGPPYVHFVIGVADREKPIARVWYIENGDKQEQEFELLP